MLLKRISCTRGLATPRVYVTSLAILRMTYAAVGWSPSTRGVRHVPSRSTRFPDFCDFQLISCPSTASVVAAEYHLPPQPRRLDHRYLTSRNRIGNEQQLTPYRDTLRVVPEAPEAPEMTFISKYCTPGSGAEGASLERTHCSAPNKMAAFTAGNDTFWSSCS